MHQEGAPLGKMHFHLRDLRSAGLHTFSLWPGSKMWTKTKFQLKKVTCVCWRGGGAVDDGEVGVLKDEDVDNDVVDNGHGR